MFERNFLWVYGIGDISEICCWGFGKEGSFEFRDLLIYYDRVFLEDRYKDWDIGVHDVIFDFEYGFVIRFTHIFSPFILFGPLYLSCVLIRLGSSCYFIGSAFRSLVFIPQLICLLTSSD
jgi:hypothetical protein